MTTQLTPIALDAVAGGAVPVTRDESPPPAGKVTRRRVPLARYVSVVVLLAVWELATVLHWTSPSTMPGPGAVAQAAWQLARSGQLVDALETSFIRVVAGSAIGIVVGVVLGLLAGFSRRAELMVDAPVQALRTVPFTAVVPLLILWMGIGESPKIAIVAFGVVFPIYINTYSGIRAVDAKFVEVARVYGLSRWQIARRVLLPGAMPSLLVGLRFALSLAWIAIIVAEQMNASSGIGFLMVDARQFLRSDVMIVCLVLYAALGLLTDVLVRALEARLLAWRQNYQGS